MAIINLHFFKRITFEAEHLEQHLKNPDEIYYRHFMTRDEYCRVVSCPDSTCHRGIIARNLMLVDINGKFNLSACFEIWKISSSQLFDLSGLFCTFGKF